MKNHFIVFDLGSRHFALPLATVERVVPMVDITPLPEPVDRILGLINVHGSIMPVVNLRRHFRLEEKRTRMNDHIIIVQASNRNMAFWVDRVQGVTRYSSDEVTQAREIVPAMPYLQGVVEGEDDMVLILGRIEDLLSHVQEDLRDRQATELAEVTGTDDANHER